MEYALNGLIQLFLLIFAAWSTLALLYIVINHRLLGKLAKENAELREKLATYEQPEPEWVRQLGWKLFEDAPSDPAISALN